MRQEKNRLTLLLSVLVALLITVSMLPDVGADGVGAMRREANKAAAGIAASPVTGGTIDLAGSEGDTMVINADGNLVANGTLTVATGLVTINGANLRVTGTLDVGPGTVSITGTTITGPSSAAFQIDPGPGQIMTSNAGTLDLSGSETHVLFGSGVGLEENDPGTLRVTDGSLGQGILIVDRLVLGGTVAATLPGIRFADTGSQPIIFGPSDATLRVTAGAGQNVQVNSNNGASGYQTSGSDSAIFGAVVGVHGSSVTGVPDFRINEAGVGVTMRVTTGVLTLEENMVLGWAVGTATNPASGTLGFDGVNTIRTASNFQVIGGTLEADGINVGGDAGAASGQIAWAAGLGVLDSLDGPPDEAIKLVDNGGAVIFRSDNPVALVDATVTTIFTIDVQALEMAGGVFKYSIRSTDDTDLQVSSGTVGWSVINKAGTLTGSINKIGTTTTITSTGTLITDFSIDTTDATVEIELDADAVGFTPTTLEIRFQIHNCSPEVITIQ